MSLSRPVRRVCAAALTAALLAGCSSGTDTAAPPASPSPSSPASTASGSPSPSASTPGTTTTTTASTSPPPARANPVVRRLPRAQWQRMVEAGMARPECPVGRADLRRLEVNHVDFTGDVQRGVLVVHRDVADSLARIFTRLFEERFPIRRMRPLEHYDGDSDASLRDDNTAAYNCRRPDQINAPFTESPHANGRAIDINPRENPWKDLRCTCWSPSKRHHERTPGKGKILKGGVVWQAFRDEGWIWQDIDVPDYMHFDTGYPSKPFPGPTGRPTTPGG